MPRKPKLMFQIWPKLRRGFSISARMPTSCEISNQIPLLRLASDLKLIKESVVFFAVTIKQRHALNRARRLQLSARQFRDLLVVESLNLEVIGVGRLKGDGDGDARVDEGHTRVGIFTSIVDLIVAFALIKTEFERCVLVV